MIRKAVVAFAAVSLAVVASLSLGSVAGAQYSPVCSVTANPSSASPGDTITLSGNLDDGVESKAGIPGQEIVFSIGDIPLGSAVTDDNGDFSTEVTIPVDLAPGAYTITASCGEGPDGEILGNTDITVTGTTTTPPGGGNQGGGANQGGGSTGGGSTGGGTLARTGTDLGLPVQIAVALLALGGIALALSASRRRAGATA